MSDVLQRIRALLSEAGVAFREVHHPPTRTSDPFSLYADPSVLENEKIAFNAGSLTDSFIMASADWQRIAAPQVFAFTKP